jgi:hypothetical protein
VTEQTAGSQATATTQATTTETTATQTQGSTTQTQGTQQTTQATQQTGQQGTVVETQSWPANWRQIWAGGDEKEEKRLQRFPSPDGVYKWSREMEKWKSSARLMPELPQNATPEQMAEYRKAMGVPEDPTKYYDGIKKVTIGEEDRPIVNKFLERMHGANATTPVVEAALDAYYAIQEEQQAADIDAQKLFRQEQEDILHQKWGPDFRSNVNAIRNTFASMPESLREGIESWVDHNGNLLMNNAAFLEWAGGLSLQLNPMSTTVPSGNGDAVKNVEARLAEFKQMRVTNMPAWEKRDDLHAEERRLLEFMSQRGGRAA